MTIITLVGIDPGIVHTGLVKIELDSHAKTIKVEDEIVVGQLDAQRQFWPEGTAALVSDTYYDLMAGALGERIVAIEKYRQRGTVFQNNTHMQRLEQELRRYLPVAQLLDNTGVKKVVTDDLMKLFNVWKFRTTNHRDLQAAARIGLYAGIRDVDVNVVMSDYVRDNIGKAEDRWLSL